MCCDCWLHDVDHLFQTYKHACVDDRFSDFGRSRVSGFVGALQHGLVSPKR